MNSKNRDQKSCFSARSLSPLVIMIKVRAFFRFCYKMVNSKVSQWSFLTYDNVIVFSLFLPIEKNGQRIKKERSLRKVTVCESSCKQNINNLLDKVLNKGLINSAHCLLLVVPLLVGHILLCDLAEFLQ